MPLFFFRPSLSLKTTEESLTWREEPFFLFRSSLRHSYPGLAPASLSLCPPEVSVFLASSCLRCLYPRHLSCIEAAALLC